MIIKKKLRDVTEKEFENWARQNCHGRNCEKCMFKYVRCTVSNSWAKYKEVLSDEFLNQEIEVETPDVLNEKEKEYLSAVIKPFRNREIKICKYKVVNNLFEYIVIIFNNSEGFWLPNFKKNTMYKGMELDKKYTLEELGLFQKNTKITLSEFWNSKEKLAIHCNTEEKANKLLKAFDKLGKRWVAKDSYLERNCWQSFREDTCYDNTNRYSFIKFYKENSYKVYEFDEVDFKGENDEK